MGIVEETRREGYESVASKRADRCDVILAILGNRQMTVSEIVKRYNQILRQKFCRAAPYGVKGSGQG